MPSFDNTKWIMTWQSRTYDRYGNLVSESLYNAPYQREVSSRPDTKRRNKPKNLFANATARSLSSDSYLIGQRACRRIDLSDGQVNYRQFPVSASTLYDPTFMGSNVGLYPYSATDFGALENSLLNRIKDQKVNLSVSVAELPKTADMLRDLAVDAYKAFHSLRSGRPFAKFIASLGNRRTSLTRRFSKDAAGRWLQYNYGILPTMMEVYGATDLLNQRALEGLYLMDKVSRTSIASGTEIIPREIAGWTRSAYNDRLSRKIVCMYKVDSTGLRTLGQTGISNPALLVWELVPYSFVFDWIIGVGDALSTLDALVGITDLKAIKMTKFSRTNALSLFEPNWADPGTVVNPGLLYHNARRLDRLVGQTLIPRLPTYSPHASVKRMLSATALLRNFSK